MYKPNFTITLSILNAISQITVIRDIVEKSRVLPLNEAQLRRQAVVRMAHTSTSIEGNPLAEYQVDKVLSGMTVVADKKSIMEVKNYQAGIKAMEKIASKIAPVSLPQVLALHAILMENLLPNEKTGRFRKGTIYVVDDLGDGREHLRFEGPPAQRTAFLLNELLKWFEYAKKEQIHPILIAGIFHLQFVSIHPFSDGNGRLARLLTQLILYRQGWDFRKILVLEDYYNRDRQAYYNALNVVQGKKYTEGHDITPWLEYFVKGFLNEARIVEEKISAIGFSKASKTEQIFLDKDELKIMEFLATTGKMTSSDIEDILKIAKRTAQLKLKGLVGKGLIKAEGKARATFYTLVA